MQQVVRKVTFATLHTTNALLQNASGSTNSNLITPSVDVVALLGHVNTQLAQFRREQIKPALKEEFSTICSSEVPLTSQYLFGDELAKQLRDTLAKLATLWVTLQSDAPILGATVLATRRVIIKGLKEIFYGEVNTDPTERKSLRSTKKKIIDQLLAIRDSVRDFPTFLPRLLSYLHDRCHNFKAGRVAAYFVAWKDLTNDRVILPHCHVT